MKGQLIILGVCNALRSPCSVQRIEKGTANNLPCPIAHDAIGKQGQRFTRRRKQDVITRLRCATHHAFEQAGIARRKGGGRHK